MPTRLDSAGKGCDSISAAAANRNEVLLGISSPGAALKSRSDALTFNRLGQLFDAIFDPINVRIDRLGLAIGIERVRLVLIFLEDGAQLCERDKILRLQRQRAPKRADGVLVI